MGEGAEVGGKPRSASERKGVSYKYTTIQLRNVPRLPQER